MNTLTYLSIDLGPRSWQLVTASDEVMEGQSWLGPLDLHKGGGDMLADYIVLILYCVCTDIVLRACIRIYYSTYSCNYNEVAIVKTEIQNT